MKINKIAIITALVATVFISRELAHGVTNMYDYTGESIQYIIKPSGISEYNNLGTVDLDGVKVNLMTLKTKVFFINITEKIYSDPDNFLPYKTERTTSGFWIKEYRTEEYDQKKFSVVIKKFRNKKLVKKKIVKADGPIQNVNTLLFYLRKQDDLKIGWNLTAVVPDELALFKLDLRLVSIDKITVPAGKFQAYHFKSIPAQYEIWLDKGSRRIPIKMKLKGIVDCSMSKEKI